MKNNAGEKKIRSFIALELSDEAREEFSRVAGILKDAEADVKWVKPESIHLTLKFLGYILEEKVPAITKKLNEIASRHSSFDVVLNDIGVFPKWSYPRVLWVGVGEGSEKVKSIAGLVEKAMAKEGFDEEKRPFSPHLTIGRIKSAKNKDKLQETAQSISVKPATSHISRIVLFKSDLTPKGAIYTALSTSDFPG